MRGAAVLAAALLVAGCVAPASRPSAPSPPPAQTAPLPEPASPRPLAELIATTPGLTRFRALAAAGDLAALIAGRGPVVVLAPADDAFARLAPGTVEALLLPGNRPSLRHLLRFWVVPGDGWARATDRAPGFASPPALATLDGEPLTALAGPDGVTLTDAGGRRARARTVAGSDGALVLLDAVVAPRSIEPGEAGRPGLSNSFRSP